MALGSGAIRAGRAFVELFADDNKLYRALDQASTRLKSTGAMWARIGGGLSVAAGAVSAPLVKLLGDAASRGADVKQLADRFNLTTQSVSALAYAFESTGASFEEFAGTLDGLGAKLASAADGNDELFRRLNLNARAMIDLPLDQQLDKVADAFARVTNPIDRANIAQELFGSSGLKLLPVLQRGSEGIRALKSEAADLGHVMDPETAARGEATMKGLNAAWLAFRSVLFEVGAALLPTVHEVRDFVAVARVIAGQVRQWVTEHRELIATVALVAGGLAAAGAALAAFGAAVSAIGAGVGAVVLVVKALIAVVGLLLNPIGLATAALVLLATQTEAAGDVADHFRELLGNLKDVALETFSGIVDALKKGDLELAFKIASSGVKSIWAELMLSLKKGWNGFVKWLINFLNDNPWILPAIGGAIGFAVGGPGGALAGASAGGLAALGLRGFGEDIKGFLSVDVREAEAAVKRARDELHALTQKAKEPPPAPVTSTPSERFELYYGKKNGGRPGLTEPPPLYGAAKGVFSGPIAQQLAYGDQVQKRQLDALTGINKNTAEIPRLADAIVKGLQFK